MIASGSRSSKEGPCEADLLYWLPASLHHENIMWQGPTVKLYVLRHRYAVIVCTACSKPQIV